jgi:hypothetical protein
LRKYSCAVRAAAREETEVNQTAGFVESSQYSRSFPALGSTRFVPRRYRPGNLRTWSGHLPFARDLIASLQPRLLVELGTHFGESYFGFCQSVEEAGISCACYAVDSWHGDAHAGEYGDEVWEEVDRYNNQCYGSFSHLLRSCFDDARPEFSDESIDLLHIDGLHTYAAVKHDWDTWFPKVAPGGIVLLHDTTARFLDFGVWKLWEELSPNYESFEFHHYHGLGVIRKPGPRNSQGGVLDYLFAADNAKAIRQYYVLCSERLDSRADLQAVGDRTSGQAFQLFYPEKGFFSERASLSAVVEPGPWRKLSFELAHGMDGEVLRLDLGTRPAIVDVGFVALLHAYDRRELWRCSPRGEERRHFAVDGTARLLPHDSLLEVFSFGDDPRMLLSVPGSVPRGEPLIFEAWVRFDSDLSRLATDGVSASGGAASVLPRLFLDPGEEVTQALSAWAVRGGKQAGFLSIPLDDPALPRNDWAIAEGKWNVEGKSHVRALTSDPWIAWSADLNSAEAGFFVIRMSCSVDGRNSNVQLFWAAKELPFEERLSIRFPLLDDGQQHLYVVDLQSADVPAEPGELWGERGQLVHVRLDPLDTPGLFHISFAGFVLQGRPTDQVIRKALGLTEAFASTRRSNR